MSSPKPQLYADKLNRKFIFHNVPIISFRHMETFVCLYCLPTTHSHSTISQSPNLSMCKHLVYCRYSFNSPEMQVLQMRRAATAVGVGPATGWRTAQGRCSPTGARLRSPRWRTGSRGRPGRGGAQQKGDGIRTNGAAASASRKAASLCRSPSSRSGACTRAQAQQAAVRKGGGVSSPRGIGLWVNRPVVVCGAG